MAPPDRACDRRPVRPWQLATGNTSRGCELARSCAVATPHRATFARVPRTPLTRSQVRGDGVRRDRVERLHQVFDVSDFALLVATLGESDTTQRRIACFLAFRELPNGRAPRMDNPTRALRRSRCWRTTAANLECVG